MADFVKAFNSGINSAEKAEENKSEISSVFDDLNNQLSGPTGGKIIIKRVQRTDALKMLKNFANIINQPKYWMISAINIHDPNNMKDLAEWKQDKAGYPCKISYGDDTIYCDDKKALENGLFYLLADASVGKTLQMLINLPLMDKDDNE